jgi:UDP-N-acetylglucosamine diphosphorylase / glucose-1-phosphate thymidylyltransferase / UDP-N-acetylgalactosamine diphosphorylase / glucosamine-1-phosphate N-acetyltransferase / galactosamine-1-phosphate N-acetyltransferase
MKISDFIETVHPTLAEMAPWLATYNSDQIVKKLIETQDSDFIYKDGNAIHRSSVVESGAVIKGPVFIGPNCLVAAGAYLRGGVWLESDIIVGPHCEVKSSYFFRNSKVAHLSFVGDSVIGSRANIEAGAMLANYRNEKADKTIRFHFNGKLIDTGVEKFGVMVGDGVRIGANAAIAPGAALMPNTIVKRLELVDQA